RLVALPMPSEIDGHHAVPPREVLGLRGEERSVARPAVHEEEGGLPRPAVVVRQLHSVAIDDWHGGLPRCSGGLAPRAERGGRGVSRRAAPGGRTRQGQRSPWPKAPNAHN